MTILAVTDATFQNAVTDASDTRPIMVVFTLVDSEPCQEVRPLVEAIATTHSDSLTVVQIDADANPDSVAVFGIQLVPAIRMVRFGILQAALDGSTTQDELQQCVATTLAATRLAVLDKTDESALRAIIAETPFDVPATLALGELLLDRGEYEQAAVLLMTVGSHPLGGGLYERARLLGDSSSDPELRACIQRYDDIEGCLDGMLALLPTADQERQDVIMRIFASIMTVRSSGDPLAIKYRQRLQTALHPSV